MSGRAPLRGRSPLGGCVLALLLLGGGCQQSPPPPSPAPHQVRYALAWARDDVTALPGGAGWTVTNDLGYVVRVTRGWVTSYSMELVECPKEALSRAARAGALVWSTLEGEAWAGHATGTPNPAAIRPMQVESLLEPVDREVGAVTLAPQSYCKLHYLLARAGREAPGLPAEVDMVDTSLHVDGSYRAPGASANTPFSIHTALAYGALFEHAGRDATALHVDTGIRGATVAVRRHRGRMFDGVDFAHMTERAVALQVLRALVDHADVEVAAGDEAR